MRDSDHRYRTITLDMGYTLVDFRGRYDQDLYCLAQRAGLDITQETIRQAVREAWDEQAQRDANETWEPSADADAAIAFEIDRQICLQVGITDPALHREANRLSREYFHDAATFRVFPEVIPTLQNLRERGLTLGIISNWGWHLADLCQQLELRSYFDFIISSARVGAAKPHPAIFQEALRLSGSEPGEVMHVGDNLRADVFGARGCGMTGVLLDRNREATTGDYPVIRSLDELVAML